MTDNAWRNPEELPLEELQRAMATSAGDGQIDDETGGDAGAEAEAERRRKWQAEHPPGHGDPPVDTEEGRRVRPSPDGHTGPA